MDFTSIIILLLLVFITLPIFRLLLDLLNKEKRDLFLSVLFTAGCIIFCAITILLLTILVETEIDIQHITWVFSGSMMFIGLLIKVKIFRDIYKRTRDPKYFHLNYFGRKVLNTGAVRRVEVNVFFITAIFFIASGAYFVAMLLHSIYSSSP